MKKLNRFDKFLINILWKLGYKPSKLSILFKVSIRTIYRKLWKK